MDETKLRRIQLILAILGSIAALILGIYNIKKTFFDKPPTPLPPSPSTQSEKIRSALEDVGASWLETLKKKQEK